MDWACLWETALVSTPCACTPHDDVAAATPSVCTPHSTVHGAWTPTSRRDGCNEVVWQALATFLFFPLLPLPWLQRCANTLSLGYSAWTQWFKAKPTQEKNMQIPVKQQFRWGAWLFIDFLKRSSPTYWVVPITLRYLHIQVLLPSWLSLSRLGIATRSGRSHFHAMALNAGRYKLESYRPFCCASVGALFCMLLESNGSGYASLSSQNLPAKNLATGNSATQQCTKCHQVQWMALISATL